jgi:hypothetical protein
MPPRTIFLSRLIGPFLLILAIAEALQPTKMIEAGNQIVSSSALLFVTGMLTLLSGLAIVLLHNIWRGGAAEVVVTVLGWALLLKGTALLILAPEVWDWMLRASHYPDIYPFYLGIALLLGLFLTYVGFLTRRVRKS